MNRVVGSIGATIAALTLFSSTALAQGSGRPVAAAPMHDRSGALIGWVTFVQENDGVQVRADVTSMTPGFHGFHIHSVGVCEGDFTSAGGHWNRASISHANHDGDMTSLYVQGDGSGTLSFVTDRFSVEDLFDSDGSAVMIHAGPDNFGNIPTRYAPAPDEATLATGDAGARAACGVVE